MKRERINAWILRLVWSTASCGLGLASELPAGAQAPVPVGPQFQVDTHTAGDQERPAVAAGPDGDFVVVWESYTSPDDDSGYSVQGQRYASDGTALGSQFQVNTYTTDSQRRSAVAVESDGDFVVVWQSYGSLGDDDADTSVQGQRYASDGTPLGSQFQVNGYTADFQDRPAVAVESDGDFVVVWQSYGSLGDDDAATSVQGQRYASDGTPLGSEFQVNSYTADHQSLPAVSVEFDGDFVVVWQSYGSPGDPSGSVQGQRYASDGTALGSEFQVNAYTSGFQNYPAVAVGSDGDFVVVWESSQSLGDTNSVQGQRYASNGTGLGSQFQVNTYTTYLQEHPAVAVESDGDFVVVWHSDGSLGDDDSLNSVQGQRYASDGTALGSEFQVNTYTTRDQDYASVAAAASGDFVVVWQSYGSPDYKSIQGQRFSAPEPSLALSHGVAAVVLALLARSRAASPGRDRAADR
jgi:hypothetical protein